MGGSLPTIVFKKALQRILKIENQSLNNDSSIIVLNLKGLLWLGT
tara:strand:- start:176 stop:310 length:135 start_codon:yes stop_codon:yes gene_type:complete